MPRGFALVLVALAGGAPPAESAPVRSSLYPADWTASHTDGEGRFLHDFSYAGYRRGEVPLPPDTGGVIFDVAADFGADATGAADATAVIQQAIDAAEEVGGGVVYFPAGVYRCDGALSVTASNINLRGDGPALSRIYFTHDSLSYTGSIRFEGAVTRGADMQLADDAPNRATVLRVDDAGDLAAGDDIAVGWTITDAFITEHGMTGVWTSFNGQWKPFFRREILAIDRSVAPHAITLDIPMRYPALLRDGASIRRESGYLSECVVENLGISNAVDYEAAWLQSQMHFLEFHGVKDSIIRNVATFVSPYEANNGYHVQSGGLMVSGSKRVTVANTTIEKAQNRGGGGNGYLFEVRQSSDVLFRDCIARDGRHNFIQNWDFGATGIVWLRCHSEGSRAVTRAAGLEFPLRAYSEYHHSLATANLVDSCTLVDGWAGGNRGTESSGAGHSATQCVYWNTDGQGAGRLRAFSYGHGYVIGTRDITVYTTSDVSLGNLNAGTEPHDFTEHLDAGADLVPQSLYENQRARRLESPTEGEGQIEGVAEGEGEVHRIHSADTNGDGRFSLSELLRVIQLYNAGEYSCAATEGESSEDGYRPGGGARGCLPHASDYFEQDWRLSLSELLRLIQLYNLGEYESCSAAEDGFRPATN